MTTAASLVAIHVNDHLDFRERGRER